MHGQHHDTRARRPLADDAQCLQAVETGKFEVKDDHAWQGEKLAITVNAGAGKVINDLQALLSRRPVLAVQERG